MCKFAGTQLPILGTQVDIHKICKVAGTQVPILGTQLDIHKMCKFAGTQVPRLGTPLEIHKCVNLLVLKYLYMVIIVEENGFQENEVNIHGFQPC